MAECVSIHPHIPLCFSQTVHHRKTWPRQKVFPLEREPKGSGLKSEISLFAHFPQKYKGPFWWVCNLRVKPFSNDWIEFPNHEKNMHIIPPHVLCHKWMSREAISCVTMVSFFSCVMSLHMHMTQTPQFSLHSCSRGWFRILFYVVIYGIELRWCCMHLSSILFCTVVLWKIINVKEGFPLEQQTFFGQYLCEK
jgi:hypothetical protein